MKNIRMKPAPIFLWLKAYQALDMISLKKFQMTIKMISVLNICELKNLHGILKDQDQD